MKETRILSSYSYKSAHDPKRLDMVEAHRLYLKLKKYLRVVPSNGLHLPEKPLPKSETERVIDLWPLAYRPKGNFLRPPVPVTWNPKAKGRELTFEEFCIAYNLKTL